MAHSLISLEGKPLSHVQLFCNPMDCSLLGSSVHGIFQASVLEWVAISFSRPFPSWPRDRTQGSRIVGRRFTLWATREALEHCPSMMSSESPFLETPHIIAPSLPFNPYSEVGAKYMPQAQTSNTKTDSNSVCFLLSLCTRNSKHQRWNTLPRKKQKQTFPWSKF